MPSTVDSRAAAGDVGFFFATNHAGSGLAGILACACCAASGVLVAVNAGCSIHGAVGQGFFRQTVRRPCLVRAKKDEEGLPSSLSIS